MKNLYYNREISTLSFNERVLQEAEDPRNPLMERLKFLGIFSSNMDEFFKVRVASIQRRLELGKSNLYDVLERITEKSQELDDRFQVAYADIMADLEREGVKILSEKEVVGLNSGLGEWLTEYFREEILPSLVPIICQKGRKFPQLADGNVYLGVTMWGDKTRYAILEIPQQLPRFVELPSGNIMYIDDVIRFCLKDIFYIFDFDRIEAFQFKISRDAELDIDNDFSEGYVRKMQRVLEQRKGGRPTRMVYDAEMPAGLQRILMKELEVGKEDTLIAGGRYHNMKDLMRFPNDRPELSYPPMDKARHPVLDRDRRPMIDVIRERDLLITYPYQSFDHVIRLLREAAIDPKVESISMTMYRAARNSRVVNALYNAARNGKQIFVSIELMARFDEENNIRISEKLREVGATVVYGVPPMKVHSKLLLIKRKGQHIGGLSTGNFNESTGELYVDSILLTADKRLTGEMAQVFDYLDKAARLRMLTSPSFKHLIVSPFDPRKRYMELIEEQRKLGADGYIFCKVNHLTDEKIIDKLRDAADAGVKMDLVIRTTCAMQPHTNIRMISILDRFLEHQRVYIFGKGAKRKVFMSSSDLMERNLDWRVEAAFPVYDPSLMKEVAEMMALQVADTAKARYYDETQSNPYVGDGSNGVAAQTATWHYLTDLYDNAETSGAHAAEAALARA